MNTPRLANQELREMTSSVKNFKNIGILGWGLIGDVLFRVPLIEAIRKHYPKTKITVIVDNNGQELLQNHPAVDVIYLYQKDKTSKFRYIKKLFSTLAWVRRQKFDCFIDMYTGGSSPMFLLASTGITITFGHRYSLRLTSAISVKKPDFCGHWSIGLGRLLEPIGIEAKNIRRGTSFFPMPFARLSEFASPKKPIILINLGAGATEKCWPIQNYVNLIKKISRLDAYDISIISNPGQENLVNNFISLCNKIDFFSYNILPKMNLNDIACIMQKSYLLITGDTGLMHLAFGVKLKCLCILTHTRPEHIEPEDVKFVACYEEDPIKTDKCGLPIILPKPSVNKVFGAFICFSSS